MNTRKSLITITSLTATFVALCAAIFSVTGIAKLFAGAALSAGVMAAALELGKIVSISFLYQYWKEIPKTLKYYLSVAAIILMVITSAGIYGYLSSAYAKVSATPLALNADIQTVQGRVGSLEQDIKRKEDRLNQLITLRSQQETRLDNMVSKSTTGNSSTIRTAQNALNQADRNVTTLQKEISNLSAQRDSLNGISISKRVEIETNGDIGTFVYIAKVLGTDLDTVVKWFTLVIVLVFDPLAVALVIAVNFLIKNNTKREEEPILQPAEPTLKEVTTVINEEQIEPYKIYTVEEPLKQDNILVEEPVTEKEILDKYLDLNGNGIPDWMESSFNWDDTSKWINNPLAKLYKENVINKR
jgi:hypothetical protein